ncbi:MAG: hypothetical protein ACM3Q2_10705 [Syntrophothermus sp.]
MSKSAEAYVKLVLKIGAWDDGYVDAYYGPKEWMPAPVPENEKGKFPYAELSAESARIIKELDGVSTAELKSLEKLRLQYLKTQMRSVNARIEILNGKKMTFDEESEVLYDAVSPVHKEEWFQDKIRQLDSILPGTGDIAARFEKFHNRFIIPAGRLDTVFQAAIKECRRRTKENIELPANENFTVAYVKDKPWGAYNWYKGDKFSLIEVNTDLPVFVDRAIDLACHEGYPGHHVYNALLEQHLVDDLGWIEYTVYPLYSPQSLIAEGTANYGIDVAFPGEERVEFEKKAIFPLAGIDPASADKYYKVLELTGDLKYATNEAARNYLDGRISREQAVEYLMKYSLSSRDRAERSLRFIEHYRSYVINYNTGQDIIHNYIEKNGGTRENNKKRWELFKEIISTPRTPSELSEPGLRGY